MGLIDTSRAAEIIGIKPDALKKIIKNGRELTAKKLGRKNALDEDELNNWIELKKKRKVSLTKGDFVSAVKFALQINYTGHTRADFGTSRQRPFMQSVENWAQGALGEIAFQKFMKEHFGVELQLEFRIFENAIVGQDIVGVIRGKTLSPPKKFISVKSGKKNGMMLIVSLREVEASERLSDYYVFTRVVYPVDIFARLFRDIPDFEDIYAEIVGYCKREDLERRPVPEAGIPDERYTKASGCLRNKDEDWGYFAGEI